MGRRAELDPRPGGAFAVEFTLTPIELGTRVDLLHSGPPETELAGHADGWAHFLPRLSVAAPGGDAGRDDWRPLDVGPSTISDEGARP